MLLYKSNLLEVNYLEVQYLIHFSFKKQLTSQELKDELLKFLDKRVRRRGRYFFIDLRSIEKVIDKEFLLWFFSKIMPEIFSLKGERLAFYTHSNWWDIPTFVIVRDKLLKIQRFGDPKEAMEWLLKDAPRRKLGLSGHRHSH